MAKLNQYTLFGTDLPSTRAPVPYADTDLLKVVDAIGEEPARKVFYDNAIRFYRPESVELSDG